MNDTSIDAESRAIIRYALETHDPWLAKLVRRAEAQEAIADELKPFDTDEHEPSDDTLEALTDMICRGGEEALTALLVLMVTLENAKQPNAVVNSVKHLAFTRYGELNVNGMIEAQVALIEGRLRAGIAPVNETKV